MAVKALNFKMEERELAEMREVASVYHMTLTQLVKDAVDDYLQKMKADPFYKLTANVQEADAEESAEILQAVEALSDDDLIIAASERVQL
ncbi:MAG: hypothetical protein IJS11_06305 [Oscillospiraceae bacterium]|nr:hypothetical protein [Oscillospiraceae bacterium]MBQ3467434.1 hypothetical protein [Oscillospiraceae bacterium]MBQ9332542.1 hypothetical protein [Oscillospiraceae bacterium]